MWILILEQSEKSCVIRVLGLDQNVFSVEEADFIKEEVSPHVVFLNRFSLHLQRNHEFLEILLKSYGYINHVP